ncbi:SIMPL domain-containing protein [Synechococcus sp. PCC 7336]|uniref:SIMPL domain-containing protein n=1 Tax=Synechococcus sp. PCC 7336 TaxID=195250 RepID=UPI00034910CE|nr:SIMPL domain-containing protein [Synechococcus sp. PCC 7336]
MRRLLPPLFAALLLSFSLALPLSAREELDRTLTVTGRGTVAVETAIATIRLGVAVEGESASEVQAEVAERTDSVVSKLQELAIDNLQTTGISLYPQTFTREDTRITSVRGENTVQFEVPVEVAGKTLDDAVGAGASRIHSISFRPTDENAEAGRDEALRLAVDDAISQAEVVLDALDFELTSIRTIQVNSASNNPIPVVQFGELSRAAATTPVVGGDRDISATVTVTVEY